MNALVAVVVVGTAIWVGLDARGRDFSKSSVARSAGAWAGALLLWIVFFPLYLTQRGRARH